MLPNQYSHGVQTTNVYRGKLNSYSVWFKLYLDDDSARYLSGGHIRENSSNAHIKKGDLLTVKYLLIEVFQSFDFMLTFNFTLGRNIESFRNILTIPMYQ